jgi:hypothetical protein
LQALCSKTIIKITNPAPIVRHVIISSVSFKYRASFAAYAP